MGVQEVGTGNLLTYVSQTPILYYRARDSPMKSVKKILETERRE